MLSDPAVVRTHWLRGFGFRIARVQCFLCDIVLVHTSAVNFSFSACVQCFFCSNVLVHTSAVYFGFRCLLFRFVRLRAPRSGRAGVEIQGPRPTLCENLERWLKRRLLD